MEKPTPSPQGPHRQGGEGARRAARLKRPCRLAGRRDPASKVYVANKAKQTVEVGMKFLGHRLDASTSRRISSTWSTSSQGSACMASWCNWLPKQIDSTKVFERNRSGQGCRWFPCGECRQLGHCQDALVACTPVVRDARQDTLASSKAWKPWVIGRSNIVGKPVPSCSWLRTAPSTIAHSRPGIFPRRARADLVIARRGLRCEGRLDQAGACVIDVGINRIERDGKGKLVGDCDYASARKWRARSRRCRAAWVPMTIACLLHNTVRAACARVSAVPEM